MDIRATNLNLLIVFDAVMATGSVTKAAERVGLTQSGASNALASLRTMFDDPLFERVGHEMRPTPLAQSISEDVRRGLESLQRALEPPGFEPSRIDRQFVLGLPDFLQLVLLPELTSTVRRCAPEARVRAVTWPHQRVPDELATGEVDLVAGFFDRIPDEHASSVLYDDQYVCLIRPEHPGLVDGQLTLESWLSYGHVVVTTEESGPTGVDRALGDVGLERRIAVRVDNSLAVPDLVAETDLVAAVDRRWAAKHAMTDRLQTVPTPLDLPAGRVRLVWHRRLESDPAGDWLRRKAIDVFD